MYQQLTSPTPEEMLVDAAKQLGKELTEVAQNIPLYDFLSTFTGLQQLADICGDKLSRGSNYNKQAHPSSDVSLPRVTKQHSNHLPVHCYPTRNKMLHTLCTTNVTYLPAYLIDAIDPADPDTVSTAYVNAIICPTPSFDIYC